MKKIPKAQPCASCDVPCCRRFVVPITGFDIKRIIDVGKKIEDFCVLENVEGIELSDHSTVFIKDGEMLREKSLVLRREEKRCVLFVEERCSIWSHHPYACRTYPFVEREGKLGYAKRLVCPRKWREGEYVEDEIREDIDRMSLEIAQHNKIVRFWNANFSKKKSEKEFFEYLISEVKKREMFSMHPML
jgi:Fe-S-cluster containining protein